VALRQTALDSGDFQSPVNNLVTHRCWPAPWLLLQGILVALKHKLD
jgi:hypothetical protein